MSNIVISKHDSFSVTDGLDASLPVLFERRIMPITPGSAQLRVALNSPIVFNVLDNGAQQIDTSTIVVTVDTQIIYQDDSVADGWNATAVRLAHSWQFTLTLVDGFIYGQNITVNITGSYIPF